MVFRINDKLVRKGISKEVYTIKAEKYVNNILHFIIKSKNTGDIILSMHAIEKIFLLRKNIPRKKILKVLLLRLVKELRIFYPINI